MTAQDKPAVGPLSADDHDYDSAQARIAVLEARISDLETEVEAHRSGAWILAETKRAQAAEARVAELEATQKTIDKIRIAC